MAGSRAQAKIAADRRARVAQMRKDQARKQRRVAALIGAGGGVIVLVIVAVIVVTAVHRHSPVGREILPSGPDATAAATTEPAAKTVKDTSGIAGVVSYDVSGHTTALPTDDGHGLPFAHVEGSVAYSVTPPVGGNHNGVWMNCGIYNAPVPTERAVHNLEHGAIWITYEPSLPKAQVAQLTAFFKKQSMVADGSAMVNGTDTKERYMDLTPWKDAGIGSPIVMSAWGHQLKLTSATDPRMQKFVDAFRRDAQDTPEMQSDCNGEPVNVSGQPISS